MSICLGINSVYKFIMHFAPVHSPQALLGLYTEMTGTEVALFLLKP